MRLDNTMIQWLTTPVKQPADFIDFCNHDFMRLHRESDYCFSVYYDQAYKEEVHSVLDSAIDKFNLEAAE